MKAPEITCSQCQSSGTKFTFSATLLAAILVLSLLLGCAEQRVRDDATTSMRDGNFETAIDTLKNGITQYPESATLHAGLSAARSEALARLSSQSIQLRANGKFDEAEKVLDRALSLDAENPRLLDLRSDLHLVRKQRSSLEEINALLAQGKKESALRRLESVLREFPKQPDLVALQRRLQQDLRFENNTVQGLSESRPITLDFKNAPLATVLDAITRGSGVNFVLDKDVKLDSRATVYLRNARVGDAIDLVAGANQLARNVMDPQTVFIYPNTAEKKREHQEQVVRVFYLANSQAQTTATLLRSMLHIKDPFVDERANMVAIREAPEVVALAERLVALHDLGEPEVMMELEVMEVSTTILNNLGLDFPNSYTFSPLAEAGVTGITVNSLGRLNGDRIGVSLPNLVLNLRREVGDTNILANPKVRAKNREKARILIGDKIPIITSTSGTSGFVSQSVNYQDVGLKLDVEPVISPDDDVTIKLALEVSTLGNPVSTSSGTVAYQIGTRNANTTLRLRDGETQILGGLVNKQDTSNAHRFPGLGDLPIAGRLFSSQRDDKSRTELVLAITPRILRSAPRPDLAQAQMWVGSELYTRLLLPPEQRGNWTNVSSSSEPAAKQSTGTSGTKEGQPVTKTLISPVKGDTPVGPVQVTWQAPTVVKAGEVFTVSLDLASGNPLGGASLEIGFDKTRLEVVDLIEGDLFRQSGGITSFSQVVNIATGRIGVGVLRSDSSAIAGHGSIVELRLKALEPGDQQLKISSIKPIAIGMQAGVGPLPVLNLQVQ